MLQDIKNTVLMITKNTIFRAKDPDTRLSSLISLYLTFRFNEGIISILQKELGKVFNRNRICQDFDWENVNFH